MTKIIFIIISFSIILFNQSWACELPRGETLTIGCSYKCDFIYRLRLRLAALVKGYPVEFINLRGFSEIPEALDSVDAVLIPGGADINPYYYLDSVTPELANYTRENLDLVNFSDEGQYRDGYEYELLKKYSVDDNFSDLPLLGVCRGMQMMSVAQGIPLYLDIQTELGIKNRLNKFDKINVHQSASLMSSLYGRKKFRGFKLHHQGLRMSYFLDHQDDYPQVRVTATSNNGLIAEAIEYHHRPALGVQYHPEKSFTKTAFPIYNWFLTKACEHHTSKDR